MKRSFPTFSTALVVVATLLLTACGFQLRGTYVLPFDSIAIALPETGELYAQLRRSLMAGSAVQVTGVEVTPPAQVVLQVLADQSSKNILSLSAAGRAREYQLVRQFSFRLVDGQGQEWLSPSRISIHRDITFNDDLVLSKESEEALLWRDIQNDLVQQVLRRLAAARAPLPVPVPAATSTPHQP